MSGVLRSEEKVVVCGCEGRPYTVYVPHHASLLKTYTVIVGNDVYQFTCECPPNPGDPSKAKAFFSGISDGKPKS